MATQLFLEKLTVSKAPIIILGGAPGVGKTTIGNTLVRELGLSHHISTGFIRAAISELVTSNQSKILGKQSFEVYRELKTKDVPHDVMVLDGVIAQAEILKNPITKCIERARSEGTGIVIEGTHCLPSIIDHKGLGVQLIGMVDVPNRNTLKGRAQNDNHLNRLLSEDQLEDICLLQDQFIAMARHHDISIIINDRLEETIHQVKQLVSHFY